MNDGCDINEKYLEFLLSILVPLGKVFLYDVTNT